MFICEYPGIALGHNNINGVTRLDKLDSDEKLLQLFWYVEIPYWRDNQGTFLKGDRSLGEIGLPSTAWKLSPRMTPEELDFVIDYIGGVSALVTIYTRKRNEWDYYNATLDLTELISSYEENEFQDIPDPIWTYWDVTSAS